MYVTLGLLYKVYLEFRRFRLFLWAQYLSLTLHASQDIASVIFCGSLEAIKHPVKCTFSHVSNWLVIRWERECMAFLYLPYLCNFYCIEVLVKLYLSCTMMLYWRFMHMIVAFFSFLQVYINTSNVDDYLVESIKKPADDPNAGEVYYRYACQQAPWFCPNKKTLGYASVWVYINFVITYLGLSKWKSVAYRVLDQLVDHLKDLENGVH